MTARTRDCGWRLVLILALTAAIGRASEPTDAGIQPVPSNSGSPPPPPAAKESSPAAPKPRPRLSPQITRQISSAVPVWSPPPAEPADKPPPPPDPDVVRMAPLVVTDSRLSRIESIDWLTPKARDTELVNQYITPFDRYFLNRFTLPLLGISKEARAHMMYEEDKRLQDMKWVNDQVENSKLLEPEAAKELLKIRDNTFARPGE